MNAVWHLMRPKWLTLRRPSRGSAGRSPLALVFFFFLGALFWWGIYSGSTWLCQKCLAIEDIGELLLQKILSMAFLTFFSILIFSNLVAAFSTFFLADDLQLLNSCPIRPIKMFSARFTETAINASWMIIVFGLPFLLAYGQTFQASPRYYLQVVLVALPFILIPSALAILIALFLASLFSAQRTRDLLFFFFILGFVGLYLYFRILQPERFLDPEQFSQAIDFLGMLRNPTSPYLPSDWAVSSLFPFLSKTSKTYQPIYLYALYSTAGASCVLAFWTHEWCYNDAFSRAQSGRKLRVQSTRAIDAVIRAVTLPFNRLTSTILRKEFRTFTRNPGQWAQLLLLGALVVVYVFNFSSLRQLSSLKVQGIPALFANLGLYLFNLVLLGFVISAVSVRFAYPAVSLEGKCFWLIRQSPVPMRTFLRTKFWSIFLPLTILAEAMAIVTNVFIRASVAYTILAVVTVGLMTTGITAIGIGLGALYPRFNEENPAKIATGFGGVLYMICSILWIAFLLLIEIYPLVQTLWNHARRLPLQPWQGALFALCAIIAFGTTALVYRISMRLGANALDNID